MDISMRYTLVLTDRLLGRAYGLMFARRGAEIYAAAVMRRRLIYLLAFGDGIFADPLDLTSRL